MHELGVVFHCIKQINGIAEENNVKKINSVTMQIGEVSTVIPHYFEDCWNWAIKKERVLENSKLIIEIIDAVTHCENCGKDYPTVAHGKICPHCGGANTFLLQGNEILIKQIEAIDSQ